MRLCCNVFTSHDHDVGLARLHLGQNDCRRKNPGVLPFGVSACVAPLGRVPTTMQAITEQFVAALADLHRNRESGPLVDMFSEDATLSKVGMPHQDQGKQGAHDFWERYRDVFDAIDATFHRIAGDERVAFLEWTSEGTLKDGSDFSYQGVSVLEAEGDLIDSFRTYYDTAAFVGR
jgi:hypothetical protein